MDSNPKFDSEDSAIITNPRVTRESLGTLSGIANSTRLDISFTVHFASQHREKPQQCHWELVKWVFRYLKGTAEQGFLLRMSQQILWIILDFADWTGDHANYKTTSGSILIANGCIVSWESKKQLVVALSTMEAELVAAAQCRRVRMDQAAPAQNVQHFVGPTAPS
ncbi:TPA: hypothetical protein N0F65_010704 [Lagenidium giganteum]|uniref:Uncharacterized protein n=1 Tax=Lagenidium giganteum TaxID=4803 RepID=A0AAV2Z901_9STRA|nr:TPA: hypothetical protein N0F65_010704 [Lagenidium giganteum]